VFQFSKIDIPKLADQKLVIL